jgi:hypothetical protein
VIRWRCRWLHRRLAVIRRLSERAGLLRCSCGRLYAINHDVQAIVRWEDVRWFYEDLAVAERYLRLVP